MMNKVIDKVFGELVYRHAWSRTESISWWGQREVKISAKAYTGEGVTDLQRAAFLDYQATITTFVSEAVPKLAAYIKETSELDHELSEVQVLKHLRPTTILFLQDGTWGILFDSDFDVENGVGAFKNNGVITVGMQDVFL